LVFLGLVGRRRNQFGGGFSLIQCTTSLRYIAL
jgi:hypothetical protein